MKSARNEELGRMRAANANLQEKLGAATRKVQSWRALARSYADDHRESVHPEYEHGCVSCALLRAQGASDEEPGIFDMLAQADLDIEVLVECIADSECETWDQVDDVIRRYKERQRADEDS